MSPKKALPLAALLTACGAPPPATSPGPAGSATTAPPGVAAPASSAAPRPPAPARRAATPLPFAADAPCKLAAPELDGAALHVGKEIYGFLDRKAQVRVHLAPGGSGFEVDAGGVLARSALSADPAQPPLLRLRESRLLSLVGWSRQGALRVSSVTGDRVEVGVELPAGATFTAPLTESVRCDDLALGAATATAASLAGESPKHVGMQMKLLKPTVPVRASATGKVVGELQLAPECLTGARACAPRIVLGSAPPKDGQVPAILSFGQTQLVGWIPTSHLTAAESGLIGVLGEGRAVPNVKLPPLPPVMTCGHDVTLHASAKSFTAEIGVVKKGTQIGVHPPHETEDGTARDVVLSGLRAADGVTFWVAAEDVTDCR